MQPAKRRQRHRRPRKVSRRRRPQHLQEQFPRPGNKFAADLQKANLDVQKIAMKLEEKDNAAQAKVLKESMPDPKEAKSKEKTEWKQKLDWGRAYLEAIKDTPGAAAEERRKDHQSNISWYMHQITFLKEPEEKVKSLQTGVQTAQKKLASAEAAAKEAERVMAEAVTKSELADQARDS